MKYDPVALGRRIATVRKRTGLSQIEFAEKLFISRSYLSQLEIGDRKPSLELIASIAELTGSTLDYLIAGKGDMRAAKAEIKDLIEQLIALEKRL